MFFGYKVKHRFRSKDSAGIVSLDEMMFLFDKDMSQIVTKWTKEEIDTYNEFWNMIREKAQLGE